MQEELNAQMKQAERFEEQAERESQEQAPFDARERQTPQGKRARVGVKRVTEVEEIYENDTMTVVPTLGTPAPETYNLEDNIA